MIDEMEEKFAETAPMIALNERLRWACLGIRGVSVAWILWDWTVSLYIWSDRATMLDRLDRLYGLDTSSVSAGGYFGAAAMAVLSMTVATIFVGYLWRLVRVFLEGRVFSVDAADRMRDLALAGVAATLVDVVVRPIGAAMLSTELLGKIPPYNWFAPHDLLYLLISGFVFALGVIFRSAVQMADDHARIV